MMIADGRAIPESRMLELLMAELAPCDLGDGIEVVHDVEAVEIEMDCDIEDDAATDGPADELASTIRFGRESLPTDDLASTVRFDRQPLAADEAGTQQYERYSAPYERIELSIEPRAYVRATIEEAKALLRSR